jgi:hypothetical protein
MALDALQTENVREYSLEAANSNCSLRPTLLPIPTVLATTTRWQGLIMEVLTTAMHLQWPSLITEALATTTLWPMRMPTPRWVPAVPENRCVQSCPRNICVLCTFYSGIRVVYKLIFLIANRYFFNFRKSKSSAAAICPGLQRHRYLHGAWPICCIARA